MKGFFLVPFFMAMCACLYFSLALGISERKLEASQSAYAICYNDHMRGSPKELLTVETVPTIP